MIRKCSSSHSSSFQLLKDSPLCVSELTTLSVCKSTFLLGWQVPSLLHQTQTQIYNLLSSPSVRAKSIQSCPTLCDPMDCRPASLFCLRDSPGKNTWVDCHFLFQGIFPTQRSNLCLLASAGRFCTTTFHLGNPTLLIPTELVVLNLWHPYFSEMCLIF